MNKNIKNVARNCSLCKANLEAWMGSMSLDKEREDALRRSYINYCPICRLNRAKSKRK